MTVGTLPLLLLVRYSRLGGALGSKAFFAEVVAWLVPVEICDIACTGKGVPNTF